VTRPGDKTHRRNKKVRQEKRRTNKNFMKHSILDVKKNITNWRLMQKNVKFPLKLKKSGKNFSHFKETNPEKKFAVPSTPHNTGQYLISNFCQVRNEKLFNYSGDFLQRDIYTNLIENAAIDDLCVTGGSMKGIINSHLFRRESDDFSTSQSISNTNNTYDMDDDGLLVGNCSIYYYDKVNDDSEQSGKFLEYKDTVQEEEASDSNFTQTSQADFYKQKIEEQKKLIDFLLNKIKSQNG
jgi:hypothetical protein